MAVNLSITQSKNTALKKEYIFVLLLPTRQSRMAGLKESIEQFSKVLALYYWIANYLSPTGDLQRKHSYMSKIGPLMPNSIAQLHMKTGIENSPTLQIFMSLDISAMCTYPEKQERLWDLGTSSFQKHNL